MTIKAWLTGQPVQLSQAQQGIPSYGLTAAGSTQGTAMALGTDLNIFTTVAASTGALLMGGVDTSTTPGPCSPSDTIVAINHGANALTIYPQLGGKISTGATNAGFSVPVGKLAEFVYIGSGAWAASVSA